MPFLFPSVNYIPISVSVTFFAGFGARFTVYMSKLHTWKLYIKQQLDIAALVCTLLFQALVPRKVTHFPLALAGPPKLRRTWDILYVPLPLMIDFISHSLMLTKILF